MKDLLVIMCNSTGELRGTMALYQSQLAAAGIDFHVEPIPEPDGTIGFRLPKIRRLIAEHGGYQFIIFSDAFDVQFFGSKKTVLGKIPRNGVLIAAEKNCHPDKSIIPLIPDVGPWRFANGGLCCGTPQSFLEWCDALEAHPKYSPEKIDQGFFNELLAENSSLANIDYNTTLFFCLYGGYDELYFSEGVPFNSSRASWAQFIHSNGGWSTDLLKERMK